mmetsp:Transcript_28338/g.70168  ORF Transcript_28338/g.70168 Transcript_28338/m.70168 type:complete len:320 (-) Transcript_28338:87-1046(-)
MARALALGNARTKAMGLCLAVLLGHLPIASGFAPCSRLPGPSSRLGPQKAASLLLRGDRDPKRGGAAGLAATAGKESGSGDTVRWSDGSPVGAASSLATLTAALLSIPITALIAGPDSALPQFQVAMAILGVGLPTLRRAAMASVSLSTPAYLLDGDAGTALILAASFATSASALASASPQKALGDGADDEPAELYLGSKALERGGRAPGRVSEEGDGELAGVSPLEAWEKEYGVQVPLSDDPREWGVGDVSRYLAEEGLSTCVEALKAANVDGRVLLSLSKEDEEELRGDMGLPLGDRRRLLLVVEALKERVQKPAEG